MPRTPIGSPILVDWMDSASYDRWIKPRDIDNTVEVCHTVGWIIAETKDVLAVAAHWGQESQQVAGIMWIPKVAILKRRRLAGVPMMGIKLPLPG